MNLKGNGFSYNESGFRWVGVCQIHEETGDKTYNFDKVIYWTT